MRTCYSTNGRYFTSKRRNKRNSASKPNHDLCSHSQNILWEWQKCPNTESATRLLLTWWYSTWPKAYSAQRRCCCFMKLLFRDYRLDASRCEIICQPRQWSVSPRVHNTRTWRNNAIVTARVEEVGSSTVGLGDHCAGLWARVREFSMVILQWIKAPIEYRSIKWLKFMLLQINASFLKG